MLRRFGFIALLLLLVLIITACDGPAQTPADEASHEEAGPANQAKTDVQVVQAVGKGDVDGLARLLKEGASANARSVSGNPALLIAVERGDPDSVRLLIDHGADVNAATPSGAILVKAANEGNREIVEMLLNAGADINGTGRGWTDEDPALFAAADGGNLDIAELLIKHGASVDQVNAKSETALMAAASKAQIEIALLILENGADINHQCLSGQTALHFAVMSGYERPEKGLEVVHLLVDHGAALDIKDGEGQTPIDIAPSNFAKVLREAGATD